MTQDFTEYDTYLDIQATLRQELAQPLTARELMDNVNWEGSTWN